MHVHVHFGLSQLLLIPAPLLLPSGTEVWAPDRGAQLDVRRGEGRHSDGMEGEKERSGGVGRGEPRLLRREEGRHSEGKEGEGR